MVEVVENNEHKVWARKWYNGLCIFMLIVCVFLIGYTFLSPEWGFVNNAMVPDKMIASIKAQLILQILLAFGSLGLVILCMLKKSWPMLIVTMVFTNFIPGISLYAADMLFSS